MDLTINSDLNCVLLVIVLLFTFFYRKHLELKHLWCPRKLFIRLKILRDKRIGNMKGLSSYIFLCINACNRFIFTQTKECLVFCLPRLNF